MRPLSMLFAPQGLVYPIARQPGGGKYESGKWILKFFL